MPRSFRRHSSNLILLSVALSTIASNGFASEKPMRPDRKVRTDSIQMRGDEPRPDVILPPIDIDNTRIESYELVQLDLPVNLPDAFDLEFEFEGESISIALERHSIRGEGFRLLVDHGDGMLVGTPAEDSRTYRGPAFGLGEDMSSASLLDDGITLMVHRTVGPVLAIQPASDFDLDVPPDMHVVYWGDQASAEGHCGVEGTADPGDMGPDPDQGRSEGGVAGTTIYLAEVGIDCDYELFQRVGNSVGAAVNTVELIMNNTSTIYERDVDVRLEVTTIIVRADSNDPYTSSTIDGRLNQFFSAWTSSPENEVFRDVAQLFSGVNFSGGTIGLAALGTVCNFSAGYGVVETLYTNSVTFRTSLTAHEFGHNWGSQHCDSSTPCHIMCSSNGSCNGISGSNLKFGASAQGQIISYRNSSNGSCIPSIGDPIVLPFEDGFETQPSANNWIHNNNTVSTTSGVNEPEGIRSLNLDATSALEYGDDEIRTNYIEMNVPVVYASYFVQHRGVEAGESLFFEYKNFGGDWVTIAEHVSDGTDQTSYVFHEHLLPSAARYSTGRLRFRAAVNENNDDFFVDSFRVAIDPGVSVQNDDCADATEVFNGANPFTTDGSTDSGIDDALTCSLTTGPTVKKDVWFTYTATCTGPIEFSTCGNSDFDLRMSIYLESSGCPQSGASPFACADDTCGTDVEINSFALAGQTFIIRIGSSDGSSGSSILTIDCGTLPPPANDECSGAVDVATGSTTVSTLNATDSGIDSQLPCSTSSGPTVRSDTWYRYVAPCTGLLDISTCGAPFDSRIDVYDASGGCPSSGAASLACNDDSCGDDASVSALALEGQELLIRIGSSDGSVGELTLEIGCTPFEEPCEGDFDGSGSVDGGDLGALLGSWGTPDGDLNGDGTTDGADLGVFLGLWGEC